VICLILMYTQGGYDAGYLYECVIGKVARDSKITATEPLRAVLIEDCDDVPVTSVAIRFASPYDCPEITRHICCVTSFHRVK